MRNLLAKSIGDFEGIVCQNEANNGKEIEVMNTGGEERESQNWPLHKLGFNLFFEKGTSRSELDAVSHPHLLFQKYSNIGQTLINAPTFITHKTCQKSLLTS